MTQGDMMTAITTTSSPTTRVDTESVTRRTGARFGTASVQAARRTLVQFRRTPQVLLMGTIQGGLFLFMFRYIFGGAIDPGQAGTYVDFLVPGFLVTVILWTGMTAPAGVAEDAASGFHDRLRSLPIPRAAAVAGRSVADTALIAWSILVTTLLGFAVGFRVHAAIGSVALGFGLLLVATYAFTWMFVAIGLVSGNAQSAQGTSTLTVIPLTFVSGAYVPLHSMPGWMQPVAANQPLTVVINAVRSLMLGGADAAGVGGHTSAYWAGLSLAWCAAIFAVFGTISVARFARRR